MKLNTVLVDDEPHAMEMFREECSNDTRIKIAGCFDSPGEALEYARGHRVDFALLDIEMPDMKGTRLAALLRELNPEMIIIFVTAYSSYAVEAITLKSDFYVLKPYTLADVNDVLERAVLLSARVKKRVFVRTFGNFDMFVDGELVKFMSKKAKELLALLVDRRGGEVTSGDILAALYEDVPDDTTTRSYTRKALLNLRKTLEALGCLDILRQSNNSYSANTTEFDCDLYDYFDAVPGAAEFAGEYMSQYSWAE